MTDAPITLAEQMAAIESQALGIRDLLDRVADGDFKRPEEWRQVKERRLAALRAAYKTLKQLERERGAA